MSIAKAKQWVREHQTELVTAFAVTAMGTITIVTISVLTKDKMPRYPFSKPQEFNEEQEALFEKMVAAARELDKALAKSPTES